jgi:hypothetical protein
MERSLFGTAITGTATSLFVLSGSMLAGEDNETTTEPFTRGPDDEASTRSGMVMTSGSPPTVVDGMELSVQITVVVEVSTQSFCSSPATIVVPAGAVKERVSPSAVLGPLLVIVTAADMVAPGAPEAGETLMARSAMASTSASISVELLAGTGSTSAGSTALSDADPPVCMPSGAFGEIR